MSNNPAATLRKKLAIYTILAIITFAAFWQVDQFEFINFDDNVYVLENVVVQSGLTKEGFFWAFGTKYFGLWNPLVWLSFMADYELYGLHAGGYHVTNLIFHILSTLLLFWLFHRMTGKTPDFAGFSSAARPLPVRGNTSPSFSRVLRAFLCPVARSSRHTDLLPAPAARP